MFAVDRGPGRRLLRFIYEATARGYGSYARRGETHAATYVRGTLASGELLPGLADVDVIILLPPDPTGAARARVRRHFARAARMAPGIIDLVFDGPMVYDETGLEQVAGRSTLTYGLDNGGAIYSGPNSDVDKIRLLERPELYGSTRTWRRLHGPERRPAEAGQDAAMRRVASWLELQNWWRWAFDACTEPNRPRNAYLCVKLIAETARIWLWLTRGDQIVDRAAALARGRVALPAEALAFERASELYRTLRRMPAAPLAEFLPPFVRLSSRLADELARQVAPAGVTEVRLRLTADSELALPHGDLPAENMAAWGAVAPRLVPLLDWRSLAMPKEPDETFALVGGDPGDPSVLAAAATAVDRGPYVTLSAERLMLRPTPAGGRARLRAVQCQVTDPVSFALASGAWVASFPNVPGFSIQDAARRALAEHSAWLTARGRKRDRTDLGRLISSARAALLWQSVADDEPELPLTADATLELLADRAVGAASVIAAAREAYHDFARTWAPPPEEVSRGLHAVVTALPAYAARPPARQPV